MKTETMDIKALGNQAAAKVLALILACAASMCAACLFGVGTADAKMTYVNVSEGYVKIVPAYNTSLALDIYEGGTGDCANASLYYRQDGHANQVFYVQRRQTYKGIGFYSLRAAHSGKVLDVCGSSPTSGSNVHQYGWHGGANQLFRFLKDDNGNLVVQSMIGDLVLDINGASLRSGVNVQAWSFNGSIAQKWKLYKWSYDPAPSITGGLNSAITSKSIPTYIGTVNDASKISCIRGNGKISVSYDRFGNRYRLYVKGVSNGTSSLTIKAYNATWGWRAWRLNNIRVSVGSLAAGSRIAA